MRLAEICPILWQKDFRSDDEARKNQIILYVNADFLVGTIQNQVTQLQKCISGPVLHRGQLQLIRNTKKSMILIFKTFASFGLLISKGFLPSFWERRVSVPLQCAWVASSRPECAAGHSDHAETWKDMWPHWPGTGLGRQCIMLAYWKIRPTFPCFQVAFISEGQHSTIRPQGNGNQESPRAALPLPALEFSLWFRQHIWDFPLK